MTTPSIPAQLETALDELTMAHNTLDIALDDARRSALHSTYTAAIQRILAFNHRTVESLHNLINTLQRQPSPTKD